MMSMLPYGAGIRRVLPLPSAAPMMAQPTNAPPPARPMGGMSSQSTTEGGPQQGGGGMNPMSGVMNAMMLKKMIGGTAPSAAGTMSTGASSGAGGGGLLADTWLGNQLGLSGSASVGDTMGAVPAAGPVQMTPLAGPGGAFGAGAMEASPGYAAAMAEPYGASLYGAGAQMGGATAAAEGGGLLAAEGAGAAAGGEAMAGGAAVGAEMAGGGALAASAPEAGLLAGMGPMGWAALGGLGLYGVGSAFDWW